MTTAAAAAAVVNKSARSASRVDALRASIPSSWRAEHMPSHLRHTEGKFKNSRGQALSYVSLFPPASEEAVRGIVFFLHGINEHCRRYYHLYEQLCENGFGVLAYDLLSHGQSDTCEHNMRAHAKKFHYFVDDTNDILAFAKASVFPQFLSKECYPTLPPIVLSGMSYGTLVSLHTVLSEKHAFGAVVLVAPAVSVEMTTTLRVQRIFAKPMSAFIPKARIVPAVNRDWICRDPEFMEDFEKDPLNYGGEMTSRMGEQSLSAMIELKKDLRVEQADSAFCKVPIMLMMGSNDKVTSLPMAKEFFERIANRDKELKIFEGPYHALFDDPEKDQVFDHLIQWLHLRFPEIAAVEAAPEKETAAAVEEQEIAPEPVSGDDEATVAEVKASVPEAAVQVDVADTQVTELKTETDVTELKTEADVTELKTETHVVETETQVVEESAAVAVQQTELKSETAVADVKTEETPVVVANTVTEASPVAAAEQPGSVPPQ
ncbi:Serine protease family s33 [Globisporangium polare]